MPQELFTPQTKFSPELYEKYIRLPQWQIEGFESHDDFRSWYANVVYEWYDQSKSRTGKWKDSCKKAIQNIEYMEDATSVYTNIDDSLAHTPVAWAFSQIQEQTSLLTNNIAKPMIVAQQESQNQYVFALNHIIEAELKANNFEQLMNDIVYDGCYYNAAYLKTCVDDSRYGIYGQKGKICVERVCPDDVFPDPFAKQFNWEYWDYVIHQHDMEIGDVRRRWPVTGFLIPDSTESSMYSSMEQQKAEDNIVSPIPKLAKGPAIKRQRIQVFECWFKDSRLKFIPKYDSPKDVIDEFGEVTTDLKPYILDEDGFIIGDWLPRYPNGRCIVMAEHVILQDMPNRLPHGSSPFIPIKFAPSENPFIPGDAVRMLIINDKLNDVLANIHSYGQKEIQRPMVVEMGTLINQQHYKRLPNKANKIIPVNMGKLGGIARIPPQEVPQFAFAQLQEYHQAMDVVAGTSAIMRGQLSDGAQLSAQAMASLQAQASSRIAMKHKQIATAIKELGRQLMWLIRRIYDQKIQVQVTNPDGTSANFDWESDKQVFESGDEEEIAKLLSMEDFVVDVQPGTGTPQAKEARLQLALNLFQQKAIDRIEVLNAAEYPNRQQVNQRMEAQYKDRIAAEAMGRKMGIAMSKAEKESGKIGKPPTSDVFSPS